VLRIAKHLGAVAGAYHKHSLETLRCRRSQNLLLPTTRYRKSSPRGGIGGLEADARYAKTAQYVIGVQLHKGRKGILAPP
jgi:hypothetical protein